MLASDVDSCIYKSIIYAYLTKEKYDHSFAVIPRHCIIHFQGQGIACVFSFTVIYKQIIFGRCTIIQ